MKQCQAAVSWTEAWAKVSDCLAGHACHQPLVPPIMSRKDSRCVRANEAVTTAYLSMLLACLPCTNICAASHILILPLPLELVPNKLS